MPRKTPKTILAALLLGLCAILALPVTALAAAPNGQMIYVGNENVTSGGYWTTDTDGSVTPYTEGDTPTDNYIHYDAGKNILTLHNATIKEALEYGTNPPNSLISGAAIGVLNQNGDANLTITLEGTNTIAEVSTGIDVLAHSSSTCGASLTITGSGSLEASSSVNQGIKVQSNGGNATLSIENAEVTATSSYNDGVRVRAEDGSNVSLTVDGGSLTATTSGGIFHGGICLQFGSGANGSGTPTVTVSNNAIVRANGNAGGIYNTSSSDIQFGTGIDGAGGIVFDGKDGAVYGDVTLQEDLEIGEGESLTIGNGANLTTGGKLTVNGGTLNGTPNGDVTYKVTGVSLNEDGLTLNVGGSETLIATITPDNATNKNVTWSSDDENVATVDQSGKVTAVAPGTATITVTTDDRGHTATCTVTVIESNLSIAIEPTALDFGSAYAGYSQPAVLTVTITNTGDQDIVLKQPSANNFQIGSLSTNTLPVNGTTTLTVQPKPNLSVGTYEEDIDIFGSNGNSSVNATLTARFQVDAPPVIPDPTWRVTVNDTDHGSVSAQPTWARYGQVVKLTVTPDEGYELRSLAVVTSSNDELALTDNGDGTWSFTMPARTVTVQASFGCDGGALCPSHSFSDVDTTAWYHDALDWAITNNVLQGYTDSGLMGPDNPLTRAQMATVLWRISGEPKADANLLGRFSDVNSQAWYASPLAWALETGLLKGYEGTDRMGPDDPLTREQATVVLMRAAEAAGQDVSGRADLSQFPDSNAVSPWAVDAMSWAVDAKLVSGIEDENGQRTLSPAGTVTRAQIAALLMNLETAANAQP